MIDVLMLAKICQVFDESDPDAVSGHLAREVIRLTERLKEIEADAELERYERMERE